VCKVGFLKNQSPELGKNDIHFYKTDIMSLCKGEILIKEVASEIFKFALVDLGSEMIREIVKRSPIYYELSNQI
jgi:hypothetical protein